MNTEIEVRPIPKKTIIIIGILIVTGILFFYLVSMGKAAKASKILVQLGYENFSNVKVYATQEFLREDINIKGMRYTISFIDNKSNQECKGFVLKDYKGNVEKDLLCNNK